MRKPAFQRLATLLVVFGLVAACGPVTVDVAADVAAPAKKKASKPKGTATPSGTAKPGATARPTTSPAATKSPSAAPTAAPTATTAATTAPTAAPTASAAATAAPPTGEWSGTMTEADARTFIGFPFTPVGRQWIYDTAIAGPLPLTVAMTWTVKTVSESESAVDTEVSILGQSQKDTQNFPRALPTPEPGDITKERIVVPAGTYDTVRVVVKQTDGTTAEQWFAKDVGIVQAKSQVQGQSATLKLKTFKAN